MTHGQRVRLLTHEDIPQAMRLKDAAGWNQTEDDWGCLLDASPEGCFGVECDGVLAATTTVIRYAPDLAWIGMVLTAPEYRERGFARCLVRRAMEFLAANQVAWIKLDATEMAVGLYESLGFEPECTLERWLRPPAPVAIPGGNGYELDLPLDRRVFGADRARLLRRLERHGAVSAPGGYAMGRPGSRAAYFGPCVCESASDARSLLANFLTRHGAGSVYWDLLPENQQAVRLAKEFGFEPSRRLTRMMRKGSSDAAPLRWDPAKSFAIAGFEYG